MRETARPSVEASVEFACGTCGKPIVLTATDTGVELANASAFVRLHSRCLNRASRWVPGQAGGPTGIDVTTG